MTRFNKLKEKIEENITRSDVEFEEIKKYLEHYGFKQERISGSHHIFKNKEGTTLSIPVHSNYTKYVYVKNVVNAIKGEKTQWH